MTLTDMNRALHDRFLALLEDSLVAALGLDFAEALVLSDKLGDQLANHELYEEAALASLPEFAEPPRGGDAALVIAEHRKLDALHADTRRVLVSLVELAATHPPHPPHSAHSAESQRRALARHLDPLLRFKHLLEHHTERENTVLYPFLDATLEADAKDALAAHLVAPHS
jgi:hypothetical protein